MPKRNPNRTPNRQIKSAIRKLLLQSRERYQCVRGKTCPCGSKIKLEAHHERPIDWDRIFQVIREEVLNDSMVPMCKECHEKITRGDAE